MDSPFVIPMITSQLTPSPSFLTSPIVEIVIGEGDEETVLTAHQTLLVEAPFLADFVNKFEASGPVIP
jgi:hypothetical protein